MRILPESAPAAVLRAASAIATAAGAQAALLDRDGAFPVEAMRAMAGAGLLAAPLPIALGGAGLADGPDGGAFLLRLLHRLGRGSLAVGRIYEAHVNALRLVLRYGTSTQKRAAARDASAGALFALWVTDAADAPLQGHPAGPDIELTGVKAFCSAAGHADRAVVTARLAECAPQMLVVTLDQGEVVTDTGLELHGMRAAATRRVDFTGCTVSPAALLGPPGCYLDEPEFSAGAWRSSAVALGGVAALRDLTAEQLAVRDRASGPHQRARFGRLAIAHHTGWLWLEQAARLAQDDMADAADVVAYVNLARTAVEAAAMEAMALVQRSLGLHAFLQANPVERICRDLATYLRQPAPDEALDEAAAHFMTGTLPGEPR